MPSVSKLLLKEAAWETAWPIKLPVVPAAAGAGAGALIAPKLACNHKRCIEQVRCGAPLHAEQPNAAPVLLQRCTLVWFTGPG